MGLGFFSLTLFGALFSRQQIAVISLFEMIALFLLSFGFSWSAVALPRFGEAELQRDHSLAYTSSARLTLVAPGLLVASLALLVFRAPLQRFIDSPDGSLILFLWIDLLLLVAREHFVHVCIASERHRIVASVYILQSLGKLIVLAAFWFELFDVSAERYLKLMVAIDAIAVACQMLALDLRVLWPLRLVRLEDLVQMLRFVAPQIYGFAALYAINWVDAYFIRQFLGEEALGGYQFVYGLFTRAAMLGLLLNNLFISPILRWNRESPATTRRFVQAVPLAILAASALGALAATSAIDPVFGHLFGNKYVDVYPSLAILLLTMPTAFVDGAHVPVLNAADRVGAVQMTAVLAAGINIAIDVIAIPHLGILGAAVGTLVAFYVRSAVLAVAAGRAAGATSPWLLLALSLPFATALSIGFRAA